MKNILSIIKEEVKEFDFLNYKTDQKEKDSTKPLYEDDFQKQFIIDSLTGDKKISLDSIKVKLTGDWEDKSSDDLTVEYLTNVEYEYGENKSIKFKLSFEGDDIKYNEGGDDRWFNNIDLKNIIVNYFDITGKKIEFVAFKAAPANIKYLFIKKYVGDLFH